MSSFSAASPGQTASSSSQGRTMEDVEDSDADLLSSDHLTAESQVSVSGFSLSGLFSGAQRLGIGTSTPNAAEPQILATGDHTHDGSNVNDTKDGVALDWYVEGPGRRVGYDNLTAIDWIFEYAKERQRQRVLKSSTRGLGGYAVQFADASQIWVILIVTGVAVGALAAFIDIAGDWLGDAKTGFCSNVEQGGKFYLSKSFCCWGHDEISSCRDWQSWSARLNITSGAGGFIVDYIVFTIFSVSFAAVASILVAKYAPYAKHSGIPEVKTMLGGFVIRRFLGSWTLIIKSLGLCLAVASGLFLGREGPLVHVACCCAHLFLKAFDSLNKNEARKREVLSAAAAAGISVAFGSPIGGVLFSLEQLSYYFPDKTMWQSFVCAMIAAITLQGLNPFRTGKLVLYQVTYHTGWHGFEMLPFALLGILGGLYGGLFIRLNMAVAEWRRSRKYFQYPVLEVICVALITALINFPIKFMRAQASELVYTLFAECVDIVDDQLDLCNSGYANTSVVALLVIAAVLGFFLSTITFGLQIPAGIILPSMAIGALYGRAVGLVVELWQTAHPDWLIFSSCEQGDRCITPGTYAIIGAASALGGATRMTVSIVVIMFELTGALTYVLPIMVAVMLSKWIGDAISPRGIYESWIHFNGYPFLDNRDENPSTIPDVPTSSVMTRIEDLVVITATEHTIHSLTQLLSTHSFRGFPVIDNARDAILLGYISRSELAYALQLAQTSRSLPTDTEAFFIHRPMADPTTTLDLRPWMDQTPMTLNASGRFGLTVSMFQKMGLRYVVFTERGALRGFMTKKDIWLALNGRQDTLERRDVLFAENTNADGVANGLLGTAEEEE